MPKYATTYLDLLRSSVQEFETAFDKWMETQVESDHTSSRGLFPTVWPKDNVDTTRMRGLELRVAETAGMAADAVRVTGSYIMVARCWGV